MTQQPSTNQQAATQLSLLSFLEHEDAQRPEDFIPVYEPWLGATEEANVLDAVRSGWISSLGKYVTAFEESFAAYCNVAHAVSVSNGTAALHLVLHALGIGHGDEVIVPALSFIASANAVHYTGARPVFADIDPVTWTIEPKEIERLRTPRTRAIMPVHLYGHPANMAAVNNLGALYNLSVLEDAAEAHGASIQGQRTGGLGLAGAFSFYANKIITTGEGGIITTNDGDLAARCRMLRDHAMPPQKRYWHNEVGFNYRMTNLQAAVGAAQMERIEDFVARKRAIAEHYTTALSNVPGLTLPAEAAGCTNVYWMYSVLIGDDYPLNREEVIQALRSRGIDSRPFFHPLDTLPPYHSATPCPTALRVGQQGINLPSSPRLQDKQVEYIADVLKELSR